MAEYLNVSYLYGGNQSSINSRGDKSLTLEISDLKIMPIEWINKLEKAALESNEELIAELPQEIPDEHSLRLKTLQD